MGGVVLAYHLPWLGLGASCSVPRSNKIVSRAKQVVYQLVSGVGSCVRHGNYRLFDLETLHCFWPIRARTCFESYIDYIDSVVFEQEVWTGLQGWGVLDFLCLTTMTLW